MPFFSPFLLQFFPLISPTPPCFCFISSFPEAFVFFLHSLGKERTTTQTIGLTALNIPCPASGQQFLELLASWLIACCFLLPFNTLNATVVERNGTLLKTLNTEPVTMLTWTWHNTLFNIAVEIFVNKKIEPSVHDSKTPTDDPVRDFSQKRWLFFLCKQLKLTFCVCLTPYTL